MATYPYPTFCTVCHMTGGCLCESKVTLHVDRELLHRVRDAVYQLRTKGILAADSTALTTVYEFIEKL